MAKRKKTPTEKAFYLEDGELLTLYNLTQAQMQQNPAGPVMVPLLQKLEVELLNRKILKTEKPENKAKG